MTTRAVHWHEGMFLRPQHFQAATRHMQHQAARGDKWLVHHNWGLRAIELDHDAIANFRFVVRSMDLRFRDGTLVSIPEDGLLPEIELKEAFERSSSVTVFVGQPILRLGRANVAAPGQGESPRFVVDALEIEDENTGVNPQPVEIRLPNLKLLLSTQDHAGYEVLPIARLEKSLRAEATPQLDVSFIPPVVACDAWKPLHAGIVQSIRDRVGKKVEVLATQITSRNIGFDSLSQGDPLLFAQLRVVNEALAVMSVHAFTPGIHPLTTYIELCRVVGQLSIFDPTRRAPDLPNYDHDDLGGCYYRVKQMIDALLDILVEPEYKERPFVGAGLRMQVDLEPAWLESAWQMFIGVQSTLEAEECTRLLTKPGQLDLKVASSDRVDTVFRLGQAGLRFTPSLRPPRALPSLPGQIYFQINRDASAADWQNVQKSLSLALRLNEKLIAGNIQGQRVLTIRTGTQTATLQFTLYVVPQSAV
jgi:type VI secretion system protein ImpJ